MNIIKYYGINIFVIYIVIFIKQKCIYIYILHIFTHKHIYVHSINCSIKSGYLYMVNNFYFIL